MGDDYLSHGGNPRTYINLTELIDFTNFCYKEYIKNEEEIIKPQLQEMNFTNIFFRAGESDYFGPLSRVCQATTPRGKVVYFFYG